MGGAVSGASVAIPVIVFVKKHSKTSWCDAVPTTQTLHAWSKRFFAFLVGTCTASALALLSQTTGYDTGGSAMSTTPTAFRGGSVVEGVLAREHQRPGARGGERIVVLEVRVQRVSGVQVVSAAGLDIVQH